MYFWWDRTLQGTEAEACPRAVSATKHGTHSSGPAQGTSGWVSTEKTLTANTGKATSTGVHKANLTASSTHTSTAEFGVEQNTQSNGQVTEHATAHTCEKEQHCFISKAVTRHLDQKQLMEKEMYLAYNSRSQSTTAGKSQRQEQRQLATPHS